MALYFTARELHDFRRNGATGDSQATPSGHVIERIPHVLGHALEMGGCQSGDVLELTGKMLNAAVSEFVGDFTERQFAVLEELLCTLNSLQDDVLFDRDILNRRKQGAEGVVLDTQLLAQVRGVFQLPVAAFAHESDDRELQLFYGSPLSILDEFKSVLIQGLLDLIHRKVAGTAGKFDLSERHASDIQADILQLLRHNTDTPVAHHVLDIECHRCFVLR